MKHGPENELPPHTDAAHRDPATGLQLAGDTARKIKAMQRQVAECEDHNTELLAALEAVRAAAQAGMQEAKTRYAQTGNPDWLLEGKVHQAYWELVRPPA